MQDLVVLAQLGGPGSTAARVLEYVSTLVEPVIYRHGNKLFVDGVDGLTATSEIPRVSARRDC